MTTRVAESQPGASTIEISPAWKDKTTWAPYVILAIFTVPIYVLGASLAVRANLFDFSGEARVTPSDARAMWGFLGAAVAAAVSATGLLLARSHNLRTWTMQRGVEDAKVRADAAANSRLKLDTAVASISLIGEGANYATPAAVAGALTTLVHLEHPVIALRCLSAAWPNSRVIDIDTATWLLVAAFDTGGDDAQEEAVTLARINVDAFAASVKESSYSSPKFGHGTWSPTVNWNTRVDIIKFYVELLSKISVEQWGNNTLVVLFDVMQREPDEVIQQVVALAVQELARLQDDRLRLPTSFGLISVGEMNKRAEEVAGPAGGMPSNRLLQLSDMVDELRNRVNLILSEKNPAP